MFAVGSGFWFFVACGLFAPARGSGSAAAAAGVPAAAPPVSLPQAGAACCMAVRARRLLLALLASGAGSGPAAAPQAPPVSPGLSGPAVAVWNASFSTCGAHARDNVDSPARAFIDAAGTVHVTGSCRTSRLLSGPTLFDVKHNCEVSLNSTNDSSPAMFADNEWISSTYSLGGDRVFGLLHNEFHGFSHGQCAMEPRRNGYCQMFSLTSALSTDGGRRWAHLRPPPHHLVATPPHRYVNDSSSLWFGFGDSGGIVRSPKDGFFYTTGHNRATIGGQANGTCLLRTDDLLSPTSWRGWNGSAFAVEFADPYRLDDDPAADTAPHICSVLEDQPHGLPRAVPPPGVCCRGKPLVLQGLSWSSFLSTFIAVLWNTAHDPNICGGAPFVFALSDDLLQWSDVSALPLPPLPNGSLAYPSLLDPAAETGGAGTSFDVVGQSPSLYFAVANPAGTGMRDHWDALVRVQLDFAATAKL